MPIYEIEIKCLLGSEEQAQILVDNMRSGDPAFAELGSHRQLNHYFVGGDIILLSSNIVKHIDRSKQDQFKHICEQARECSVRTRQADNKVLLVIKAAVDDTTSANGTARLEFEAEVNLSLPELDQLVINSGFAYQAKWSRERREYKYMGLDVAVDKNAGYGYLVEFEKQISDPAEAELIKTVIRDRMTELGLVELPQDRLERMFAYYNQNWQDYYGTDKTFVVD